MAYYEWDEYGSRWYVDDQGNETPAPETGPIETLAVAAGKQFTDLGRGIRSALGQDVTQEAQEAQRYYAPLEAESPIASAVGEMLPTLPGAVIGAPGVIAGAATQTALGALEGYLDYDPRASGGQRAAAGAAGGVLGELGGRAVGRIMNMTRGILRDMPRIGGRGQAANPAAQTYENLGGQTLAYQRLAQDTPAARLAERAAQGAEASINPPPAMRQVMAANDQLHRNTAVEAVGLDPAQFRNLGPDFIDQATDRFNRGFRQVEDVARQAGELNVSETLGAKLARLRPIKEARQDFGLFDGIDKGILAPGEYVEARATLADAIRKAYADTPSAAKRLEPLLEELDNQIGRRVGPDFAPEFAKLREQYRVFSILEAPNVINSQGDINVRTLNNRLRSKTSGFGRKATGQADATNRETNQLIDLMRAADNPEFKAFRSSGTAENLALGQVLEQGAEALTGVLGGDPRPALGFAGKLIAPRVVGASQLGGGQLFEGAFSPAARGLTAGGGFVGRSLLDEALYPFVGADDERVTAGP